MTDNIKSIPPQHMDGSINHLSLRDHFAASVLPAIYKEHWEEVVNNGATFSDDWPDSLAADAYRLADAMISARRLS